MQRAATIISIGVNALYQIPEKPAVVVVKAERPIEDANLTFFGAPKPFFLLGVPNPGTVKPMAAPFIILPAAKPEEPVKQLPPEAPVENNVPSVPTLEHVPQRKPVTKPVRKFFTRR